MRTLTSTLLAAQKANARKPAILAVLYPRPQQLNNPRKLVWTRYYTGSENDDPIAAAIATDGSLVRLRANGTTIQHSRVASPGSGSTFSAWTNLSTGQTDGPVALAAGPSGELCALWTRSSGTILRTATSTDNGATWSAPADVLTEGAAIVAIGATFHNGSGSTPGDVTAFYVVSDTPKRLHRTSGSWAASGTSWTHAATVTTVTGIAATFDGADAHLAYTGTDADGNPRVWAGIFGIEGLPANLWGTPIVVQEADALSTVAYDNPTLDYSANGSFLAYTLTESGDVAAVRTFLSSPGEPEFNASGFFEPWPAQPDSASGAALCRDSSNNTWLVQSSGVWFAPFPDTVDVTDQLLALDVRFAPESTRATVELDETTAIDGLTDFVGGSLHLGLGLETASGTEYGNSTNLHIESIERTVANGRRFATLQCSGPWEAARATRAQQTWQRAAGELTRAQLFSYFARRARVLVSDEGGSDWTTIEPAFAWQAGETVATAVKRVLSVAEEAVRADEGYFHVISPPSASAYDYGPSDHPVRAFTVATAPAPTNWARLQGIDRYADAVDFDEVDAYGPRFDIARSLEADTDTKATDYAVAALDRSTLFKAAGRLRAPANVGQEMFDVVTVSDAHLGDADYRVVGLRYIFARTVRAPRFDIELDLASV